MESGEVRAELNLTFRGHAYRICLLICNLVSRGGELVKRPFGPPFAFLFLRMLALFTFVWPPVINLACLSLLFSIFLTLFFHFSLFFFPLESHAPL